MQQVDKLVEENMRLVYHQLTRFKLLNDPDAESYACEALFRAAATYDPSSGNAFSTYAVCVIANEIRQHLRRIQRKRQIQCVSLYEPLSHDTEGYLIDTISAVASTESTVCANELKIAVANAITKILNSTTNETQRTILQLWLSSAGELTQCEIADKVNTSQSIVSRYISNFKHKLLKELEAYL